MDVGRLHAWLKDPKRKPANLAFTAGEERQAAYWMEMAMKEAVKTETTTLYSIECRTGCSCCAYENHVRGLYGTMEEAERRRDKFHSMPLLASQYARTGRYQIRTHQAEKLPDGRYIVDGERVVQPDKVVKVDADGQPDSDDQIGNDSWPS